MEEAGLAWWITFLGTPVTGMRYEKKASRLNSSKQAKESVANILVPDVTVFKVQWLFHVVPVSDFLDEQVYFTGNA